MNILDLDFPDWEDAVVRAGWKKYRGGQIFHWLHRQRIFDPAAMSNLPADIKDWLQREFEPYPGIHDPDVRKSLRDGSEKILYSLPGDSHPGGKEMEIVYLPHKTWNSVCLSTQSGCSLNCGFCASGRIPFKGNLSVAEMVFPVYDLIRKTEEKINNIVFMGMGEPFYNYENTLKAARILSRQEGAGIGVKKIAISTSGVLPAMEQFLRDKEPFALALSLHFFDHGKRRDFMDVEDKYPIAEVIRFLVQNKDYFNRRTIMLEYLHLPGINDSPEEARELGKLGQILGGRINLVPYNGETLKIKNYLLRKPSWQQSVDFQNQVKRLYKMVFIRNSAGEDIAGACGMLAGSFAKEREN